MAPNYVMRTGPLKIEMKIFYMNYSELIRSNKNETEVPLIHELLEKKHS